MSSKDLNNFLKALDAVKEDYTCGVCSELCKNPVTLSKCFHLICASHFEGLDACPSCGTNLEGCKTFTDERLAVCINSANKLDEIFSCFRSKETSTTKQDKIESNSKTTLTDVRKPQAKLRSHDISIASSKFSKSSEKRNNKGETPLHIACRLGKVDKITELLNQGVNTNTKDNAGWTPLHEVVQNGRLDLVTLLLQYNTLIDVPGLNNETPLHEAVRYGHREIIKELVKHGADINCRNSKGETPLQLATDDLKIILKKASESLIQTQSVNVTHMSILHSELDFDDIRVYCVSQQKSVVSKLKLLCKQHSNLHIEVKFTKKVTHLIVDAENGICMSTIDVLQGIVNSIWILTSDWVLKSTEDSLEQFEQFEVTGVGTASYNGPKTARYNKYKQLPGVFDGCHFYLHNFNMKYEISKHLVLTKATISKLITDAGGIVLRRVPNPESIPDQEKLVPYHAKKDGKLYICSHYIIFKDTYQPMYNMQHLKALPIGWLIECIERYELCDP
ncbi:BRCA1-associated RING domain protein 1-like [Bombyx mandarina]|uniref:BRCA1-associated RING domain protein 1-like n=1 Tax=Bombyx mandarina TaxID=7092 RepID=A0A6J2JM63_BOMMA|nr:BRCA1-associated RING domain protein 1-like [Bombyx mandarina]